MSFGTVLELLAAVFFVFGLYQAVRIVLFYLLYDKSVRRSIKIAVELERDDDEETRELKELCASRLARELLCDREYIVIENDEEDSKEE